METHGSAGWMVLTGLFVLLAAFLLVFGYLIRVHKKLNLLAGHHPARVVDRDALARLAGLLFYVMGIGTLMVPFLMLVFTGDVAVVVIGVGYMVFIWAAVLTMVIGARRYVK